jgi:hypothetical protein
MVVQIAKYIRYVYLARGAIFPRDTRYLAIGAKRRADGASHFASPLQASGCTIRQRADRFL